MSTPIANQPSLKNRFFLLAIIALFALPLLSAWLLVGYWRPSSTTNHGELLNPVQPVSYLSLRQINGQELSENYLRGRWSLIYVGSASSECNRRCQDSLYKLRQVRLALGKDMDRVQTLFIMAALPDAKLAAWLHNEHAAMTAGIADTQTLDFFSQAFAGVTAMGDWIYLVDPVGNLFMRYKAESDPKGILEDLRHLLKFSKLG